MPAIYKSKTYDHRVQMYRLGSMLLTARELTSPRAGLLFTAHASGAPDAPCTWSTALQELRQGPVGIQMSQLLAQMRFHDLYWECRPISWPEVDTQQFTFVVLDAGGSLNRSTASDDAFRDHLQAASLSVVSFPNLGGDATLVVPAQVSGAQPEAYGHLANFVRQAPDAQQALFWRTVSEEMISSLKKSAPAPVWLSTAGNGVPWVHVRTDSWPKYVKHDPFRTHHLSVSVSDGQLRLKHDDL